MGGTPIILAYVRIPMGTTTVRIEENVHERLHAHKRDEETLSDAIDRLLDDYTIVDLFENTEPIPDPEETGATECMTPTSVADHQSGR
jgi:predicted CopG family antitoxin